MKIYWEFFRLLRIRIPTWQARKETTRLPFRGNSISRQFEYIFLEKLIFVRNWSGMRVETDNENYVLLSKNKLWHRIKFNLNLVGTTELLSMSISIQHDLNFKRFQNKDNKSKSNFLNSFHPNFLEFFQTEKDHQSDSESIFPFIECWDCVSFVKKGKEHGRWSISLNKFGEHKSFEPLEPLWIATLRWSWDFIDSRFWWLVN